MIRAETEITLSRVDDGANGATFTPSVDADGDISWTNDKGLPNPATQNIKGPAGDDANIWTTSTAPTTPNYTFTISNLTGGSGSVKVGDIILYSYYRYTVTSVGSTTVLAGSRQSLRGATGTAGKWYTGTGITGTSTTATIFSGSGVSSAVVGDMYLNTSTNNTYRCTTAGNASTAKWVYVCNIEGDPGTPAVQISTVAQQWKLSTSNSTATPAGDTYSWGDTIPTWVAGTYYWTRTKTTKADSSVDYSTPVLDTEAQYAAEANSIITSQNNHFWHDGSGAYVTKANGSYATDYATKITAEGIAHTYNGNKLALQSSSALVYYQSDGTTKMAEYGATGMKVFGNGVEVTSLGTDGCDVRTPEGITGFRVASCGALQSRSISYALNDQITTTAKTYYIKDISNLTNGSSIIAVFNNFGSYLYSATMTFTKGTSETKTATKNSITITGTYDGDGTFTFKTNTSTAWINNISYDAVCHDTSISLRGNVLTDGSWFTESKKVLWTNSSPTSNFANQTVLANNTELGACDFLEIYWYLNSSGRQFCTRVEFGMDGRLFFYGNGNYGYREFSSSASGVVFDVGHYNSSSTSNGYCIPGMIIGVRKV